MSSDNERFNLRRGLLKSAAALGGLFAIGEARAHHTDTHMEATSLHRLLYQCNESDTDYLQHILFSAGEMVRIYREPRWSGQPG